MIRADPFNGDPTGAGPEKGFALYRSANPVLGAWKPIYTKPDAMGLDIFAIRVSAAHCNNDQGLHGGVLAALADTAMGLAVAKSHEGSHSVVTISLQADYLRKIPVHAWLEIRPHILRKGRQIAFTQAEVFADDLLSARASATFFTAARRTSE